MKKKKSKSLLLRDYVDTYALERSLELTTVKQYREAVAIFDKWRKSVTAVIVPFRNFPMRVLRMLSS